MLFASGVDPVCREFATIWIRIEFECTVSVFSLAHFSLERLTFRLNVQTKHSLSLHSFRFNFPLHSVYQEDENQYVGSNAQAFDNRRFDSASDDSEEEQRSTTQSSHRSSSNHRKSHKKHRISDGVLSSSSRENRTGRRINEAHAAMAPKLRSTKGSKKENAEIQALKKQLAEQQKKNQATEQQLQALAAKNSGKPRLGKMPENTEIKKEVFVQAGALGKKLWRTTKFINNADQEFDACRIVMEDVHGIQDLLEGDPAKVQENISAFVATYGSDVCTSINTARSNSQSAMKKAYMERALAKLPMPTPKQLKTVILRTPEALLYPERPVAPDESDFDNGEDDPEFKAQLETFQSENKKFGVALDIINQNRAWFMWYWTKLLPCVAGSHRWSKNIRCYGCISTSTFPDNTDLKHITSSDEALVVVLFENCGQRWPFLVTQAKGKSNYKVSKEDKKHDSYQSAYSDTKAGQKKYGGWYKKGRDRHVQVEKAIRRAKKQEHVLDLESAILGAIQMDEDIKIGKSNKRKSRDPDDFEQEDTKVWRKVGVESDALTDPEGEDEMDLDDFDDNYGEQGGKKAEEDGDSDSSTVVD